MTVVLRVLGVVGLPAPESPRAIPEWVLVRPINRPLDSTLPRETREVQMAPTAQHSGAAFPPMGAFRRA